MEMEDGLDDLFGEGPTIQLPVPLAKGLIDRVDELSTSGCRQRLAWSRIGCIASVTPDGQGVVVQFLQCDAVYGQWTLSKQYPLDDVRGVHGNQQLAHLSWNHSGNELAVIDAAGCISVHVLMFAINRYTSVRKIVLDDGDDLDAVVGFAWMYIDRPERNEYFYKPMRKVNGTWNFECSNQKFGGPKVPRDRSGFVAVTRAGVVKVTYQSLEGWPEIKCALQEGTSPNELLTHAAICWDKSGDKDSLLVVTHDIQRQMRLYRLKVNFEKEAIQIQLLQIVDHVMPTTDEGNPEAEIDGIDLSSARLMHLELVSSGPESKSRAPMRPFILAGFSSLNEDFQNRGQHQTILSRWELESGNSGLHSSFDAISRGEQPPPNSNTKDYTLKRLADRQLPKTLLGTHQLNLSTVLVILTSDGLIEFRDRVNLEPVVQDQDESQVTSLPHIGFSILNGRPALHAALSPSGVALYTLDNHLTPAVSTLQYPTGTVDIMDDAFFERMCEAFVQQLSWASLPSSNYIEDLLYVFQNFSREMLADHTSNVELGLSSLTDRSSFKAHLLSEICRVLGIGIDHSMDSPQEYAFQKQFYQRCLSLQSGLEYRGDDFSRSLPGLLAWTSLSVRYLSTLFLVTYSRNANARTAPGMPESETKNPEAVNLFLGPVKWFMTLLTYIFDEVFALSHEFPDAEALESLDAERLNAYLATRNSPALPLLLASSTRHILRVDGRWTSKLVSESKSYRDPPPAPPSSSSPQVLQQHQTAVHLSRAYRDLEQLLGSSLVELPKAEKLFSRVDQLVKQVYSNNNDSTNVTGEKQPAVGSNDQAASPITPEARGVIERDLMIKGIVSDVHVKGVIRPLLSDLVETLKEEVDAAEIYFADVSLIELTLPPAPAPPATSDAAGMGMSLDASSAAAAETRQQLHRAARKERASRPLIDAMRKTVIRRQAGRSGGGGGGAHRNGQLTNGTSTTTKRHPSHSSTLNQPPLKLRRCTRCNNVTEDIAPSRSSGMVVTGVVVRECFCGGRWFVMDKEDLERLERERRGEWV